MNTAADVHRFTVRTAVADDVPALAGIYRRASLSNDGDRPFLLAHPEALVFDDALVHDRRTRLALDGDTIVGFATTRIVAMTVELDDLFVDPDQQRRGIARQLVADAVDIVRALGVGHLEVTANGHAREFYESVGFELDHMVDTQFAPGYRMRLDLGRDVGRDVGRDRP